MSEAQWANKRKNEYTWNFSRIVQTDQHSDAVKTDAVFIYSSLTLNIASMSNHFSKMVY
jgi:hypothetical protein